MRRADVFAAAAAGVAVACCAALPSVVAFLGGLTVAEVLGTGVLVAALAGLALAVLVRLRRGRRRGAR